MNANKSSLISKEIIPFLVLFGLLILITLIVDVILHIYKLNYITTALGIIGTFLIIISFAYSLRKRKIIQFSTPKKLLRLHEVLSLLGALFILVHAGIHFNALLPWVALTAMLLSVFSGLTGSFLLKRSRQYISNKKAVYKKEGLSKEEIDKKLFTDATSYELMKKWREIHFPITLIFALLGTIHIIVILIFS